MKLNTYKSEVSPGCFVTIPAATAASTIAMVDELAALHLHLARHAYAIPPEASDSESVVSILTQIVDRGYALHTADGLAWEH